MCLYPRAVWRYKNSKGKPFFTAPPTDCPDKIETFLLPCGECHECLTKYSREWALRCVLESSQYKSNCFLTLTYANAPENVCKRDLQLFLKRFRKMIEPLKVRYFACGEYGGKGGRPHYHVCVFGYDFKDKILWSRSKSGQKVFVSDTLRKLWDNYSSDLGFSYVQELTFDTCFYTAKYLQKLDTRSHEVKPFLMMSTHPGIGACGADPSLIRYDKIYLSGGRSFNIPRYFLKLYEKDGIDLTFLRQGRLKRMKLAGGDPLTVVKNRRNYKKLCSKLPLRKLTNVEESARILLLNQGDVII